MLVEEISRAIRQFAPDYRGNCVNDEPQAVFDDIGCFVSVAVVRISPVFVHGASTRPGLAVVRAFLLLVAEAPVFRGDCLQCSYVVAPILLQSRRNGSQSSVTEPLHPRDSNGRAEAGGARRRE